MGEQIRLIYLIKPLMFLIPEIRRPEAEVKRTEKVIWTAITLFIFLICSQIPLYGIYKSEGSDPLHWMRVILASNRGTLMELGISPIITSSMIMQVLAGMRLIDVDFSLKQDRNLYLGITKLFGLLITFGEAVAAVLSGMYGEVGLIGVTNCLLLVFQLQFAGFLVLILDEVLAQGYGIGSGISMFIAVNISENIIWKAFSPFTVTSDRGVEYEGAFIATVHFLVTKKNKTEALYHAFYRSHVPNLSNFVATIVVFFVVIYFEGFRKEIKIPMRAIPGHYASRAIELFYCSNTPIILQSAAVSNLYFLSQMLYRRYKSFLIIQLIGQWKDVDGYEVPVGGLAYYISPPNDFTEFITEPIHSFCYVAFVVASCGLFAKTWVEMSGVSSRDIARQLRDNNYFLEAMKEGEENTYELLNRYIPCAATLGGMCIGILTVFADLFNAIGSGTGIMLAVNIIYEYFEDFKKDARKKKMEISEDEE